MENPNCFKSFVFKKNLIMTSKQMTFQHQSIMKDLAMKAFGTIIN